MSDNLNASSGQAVAPMPWPDFMKQSLCPRFNSAERPKMAPMSTQETGVRSVSMKMAEIAS